MSATRVKFAHPLGIGLYHEVKVGAANCSAQSAIIMHRLVIADRADSAIVSPWVEDCEPIDFFAFAVTECPLSLLEHVDPDRVGDRHAAKIGTALDGSDVEYDEDGVILYKEV